MNWTYLIVIFYCKKTWEAVIVPRNVKHFIESVRGQKLTYKKLSLWLSILLIASHLVYALVIIPPLKSEAHSKDEIKKAKAKVWNMADDTKEVKDAYEGARKDAEKDIDEINEKFDNVLEGECP